MKHQTVQTGGTGWPSGNILHFHARLPEVWGSNPGGEKEICLCIGRGDLVVGIPSSQRCRLSPNHCGPCYSTNYTSRERQYNDQLTVENKCTPTSQNIAKVATRKRDRINRNMTRVMETFFMPTRCTSSFHSLSILHLQTLCTISQFLVSLTSIKVQVLQALE